MNQQIQQADTSAKLQQLLVKCWADEEFKKQMLADPMATMKAQGVEPPAGLTIKVVENTADVQYLVIPVKASALSDDDLENVAGGGSAGIVEGFFNKLSETVYKINTTTRPSPDQPSTLLPFPSSW